MVSNIKERGEREQLVLRKRTFKKYLAHKRGALKQFVWKKKKSLQRCIGGESEPLHGVGEAKLMYITCTPRNAPERCLSRASCTGQDHTRGIHREGEMNGSKSNHRTFPNGFSRDVTVFKIC